jgi:opacity protein-like surface antigen
MYMFAAALAAVISSPASARDGSGYVGLDLGALFPSGTSVDGKLTNVTTGDSGSLADAAKLHYKTGYDAALVAGYDFGMFRLEAEGGYKHAGLDRFQLSGALIGLLDDAGLDVGDGNLPIEDSNVRVLSGMINGLVDFNFGAPGFGGFVGAGVGVADVRYSFAGEGSGDTKFAWQLLAGIRAPVSSNIDLGLKYRYFQTGTLKFSESGDVDGDIISGQLSGKLRTHSVLASLVYNFAGRSAPYAPAPVAAPAAPPPPATQTCPDGSVVLATDACPPPPAPPPPPPAPKAERG